MFAFLLPACVVFFVHGTSCEAGLCCEDLHGTQGQLPLTQPPPHGARRFAEPASCVQSAASARNRHSPLFRRNRHVSSARHSARHLLCRGSRLQRAPSRWATCRSQLIVASFSLLSGPRGAASCLLLGCALPSKASCRRRAAPRARALLERRGRGARAGSDDAGPPRALQPQCEPKMGAALNLAASLRTSRKRSARARRDGARLSASSFGLCALCSRRLRASSAAAWADRDAAW